MSERLDHILKEARGRLASAQADASDAEILIAHGLGRSRSWLIAHGDYRPDSNEKERLQELIRRRAAGEPAAYLLGRREFWSLELEIGPAVLVPRPETELLVERALTLLSEHGPQSVLELGTGSGAIAIAIATERPLCEITATDISVEALTVARRNAERLAPGRIRFLASDWYAGLGTAQFDLVVSNPPYVAEGDPCLGNPTIAHEPRHALVAGGDGLDAIRRIAAGAAAHLEPAGRLLVEHGAMQAAGVAGILAAQGLRIIGCHRDLAGRERVTEAGRPEARK